MKIDFLSGYTELQKALAHHSRSADSSRSQTSRLFEQQIQGIEKTPVIAPPEPQHAAQEVQNQNAPLARLGSLGLDLMPPRVEALEVTPSVKEPAPSVKTPQIVRIERLAGRPEPELAKALINQMAPDLGIDPALGIAVAKAESSFNPLAVSSDGFESKGLFQLLDSTAATVIARDGLRENFDPYNPEDNTRVGLSYLRYLHDVFSAATPVSADLTSVAAANSTSLEKLAVAAYNAGEGRVAAAQGRAKRLGFDPSEYDQVRSYLPEITQKYVDRVQRFRQSE
jgi:soluble lytic murein transglycosylase-like protein